MLGAIGKPPEPLPAASYEKERTDRSICSREKWAERAGQAHGVAHVRSGDALAAARAQTLTEHALKGLVRISARVFVYTVRASQLRLTHPLVVRCIDWWAQEVISWEEPAPPSDPPYEPEV